MSHGLVGLVLIQQRLEARVVAEGVPGRMEAKQAYRHVGRFQTPGTTRRGHGRLLKKHSAFVKRWVPMVADLRCTYDDFAEAIYHVDRTLIEPSSSNETGT